MSYYDENNKIKRTRINNKDKKNTINRNERPRYEESKNTNKAKSSKRKKRRKKKGNIFKKLMSFILMSFMFISIFAFGFITMSIKDLPIVDKQTLESNYINKTNVVTIDEIPAYIKDAIVSIEDERFYKHNGVDITSLVRSTLNNIFTDTVQGGSTIDMQVSKNLLTNSDKTIKRKVKDIYYAIQMNKNMSKDDILEAYLNNIYLGKSAYGVADGAKAYFGKDVRELTLAQSAMLVGITNNPGKYMHHSEAKKRQETILYKMNELGYITESEYIDAVNEAVPFI